MATNTKFDGNRGAGPSGYAIAVSTATVAIPLELNQCSVRNNRYTGTGPGPAAVDAGAGGIKFKTTNVTDNSGNGVKGTVVSLGGNVVANSLATSGGWLPIPIDYVW